LSSAATASTLWRAHELYCPTMYSAHSILYKLELSTHKVKYIQDVPGGNVIILGSRTIGHSKQTSVYVYVLFWMVSEIEVFHCTVAKLLIKRYYILFLILVFIVQVTKLVQFT